MIDWLQVVILALIQGVTEFLPVSSSAHLLLPSELLGWPDQAEKGLSKIKHHRAQGTRMDANVEGQTLIRPPQEFGRQQ